MRFTIEAAGTAVGLCSDPTKQAAIARGSL